MTLKLKIDKATFDALPEAVRGEYKATGMDYTLDLDGYEDPGELRRARDREKQNATEEKTKRVAAETKVTELETQLHDETAAGARKKGDIVTLEASWKAKVEAEKTAGTQAADKLKAALKKTIVNGTAEALARELSDTNAPILLPHILSRLEIDFEGTEPALRVLTDGKPSALTVDELKKEFVANKDFAAIIVGSKAAGGGANGGKQGGGGATKKLSEMSEKERTEFAKSNPEAFKKESAEAQTLRI